MKKTPRELNTAFDLAQQKIIHLKAHRYNFAALNTVVHNWIQNPSSATQHKNLKVLKAS
ncbi:hypothetical protein [Polynucleobacter sp. MWH-UH2A]|uniref:hypothetical protein n=1 Tax=Polynucleobacter sp. MWH-UH2A TaxID=1855617 RepID=UPI001BFE0D9C|nr:hypothetical protein [Polynucleobacter sp. MWH-UH2A]QWD63384.1 hypothetical protein IC571_06695 [Polynucleobacter sp. MWH-UH2A]